MATFCFGVINLLLCFVNSAVVNGAKRQVHHTPDPNQPGAHTTPASDPLAAWLASTSTTRPNVLFLIADDLRPKLGCYDDASMVTPNLDFLASKSVVFKQAFAQVALCSPSRTSFLTGRRAETTRVFNLDDYFRTVAGNFTTLPQYFKQHGYFSQGVGKIFHPGTASGGHLDYPYSWSERNFDGTDPQNSRQHQVSTIQPVNETTFGKLQDTDIADFAVNFLHRARDSDQPFFLAVGFHKPHLPWTIPQQYLDLYPARNIHLALHRTKPPTVPDIAWNGGGEIRNYHDIIAVNASAIGAYIPDFYQYKMIQAYSAAVSYMDAQVGRVLQALKDNGFGGNTIISFLGDHGWHLGDNDEWTKHTNYDVAIRIPMMLYIPEVTSHGHNFQFIDALAPGFNGSQSLPRLHATSDLVEALDLYPTLAELAGLPVPQTCPENSQHVEVCVEGTSLLPLVRKVRGLPNGEEFQWKDAAFSVFMRRGQSLHAVLGVSMRTVGQRYTEWVSYHKDTHAVDFSHVVARELYDHATDPEEFTNLADDPAHHAQVQQLSQKLRQGWRKVLHDYLATLHR